MADRDLRARIKELERKLATCWHDSLLREIETVTGLDTSKLSGTEKERLVNHVTYYIDENLPQWVDEWIEIEGLRQKVGEVV